MWSAPPHDEQQRRLLRGEVHLGRRLGVEVREGALEQHAGGAGDVVPVVDLLRLLLGQRVGEGVAELLRRERHGFVAVEGIPEHGPRRPQRRQRQPQHPLDGPRVDRDARRAHPAVQQQLREGAAEGVPHDDRRLVEPADDPLVVVDDLTDPQPRKRTRILPDGLDPTFQPRPRRRQHPKPGGLVPLDPPLPAQRRHPQPMHQNHSPSTHDNLHPIQNVLSQLALSLPPLAPTVNQNKTDRSVT